MSGSSQLTTAKTSNQMMPAANAIKVLPYRARLDLGPSTVELDLTNAQTSGVIDQIQSIYIDNSGNLQPVTVGCSLTNQTVTCPPQSQGFFPLLIAMPPKITFTSTGAVIVPVWLINVPMPVGAWSAVSMGGNPTVTLTSRSTVSPNPASSQQLMAANRLRRYVIIKAPETADLWINPFGGVAGVGLADCFKIIMGGQYETNSLAWSAQINYFTTATGAVVSAAEA